MTFFLPLSVLNCQQNSLFSLCSVFLIRDGRKKAIQRSQKRWTSWAWHHCFALLSFCELFQRMQCITLSIYSTSSSNCLLHNKAWMAAFTLHQMNCTNRAIKAERKRSVNQPKYLLVCTACDIRDEIYGKHVSKAKKQKVVWGIGQYFSLSPF